MVSSLLICALSWHLSSSKFIPAETTHRNENSDEGTSTYKIPNEYLSGNQLYMKNNEVKTTMSTLQDGNSQLDESTKDFTLHKRPEVDFGYASRISAAENLARDQLERGLFGVYGPGKRSSEQNSKTHDSKNGDLFNRNARPYDAGYGTRVRTVSHLASHSKSKGLFGPMGPGR